MLRILYTCEIFVILPRNPDFFSFSGEVGAEVVRLLGRGGCWPVMSVPSLEAALGRLPLGVTGELTPSALEKKIRIKKILIKNKLYVLYIEKRICLGMPLTILYNIIRNIYCIIFTWTVHY